MGSAQHPEPLTPVQASEAIQRILELPGSVSLTHHACDRGGDRNFDIHDALRVLERGCVDTKPSWNERHKNWVYSIRGVDIDGDPLVLRIAIDTDDDRIVVITGHDD